MFILGGEASVTFISPGWSGACGTVMDFGESGRSVEGACNYLVAGPGEKHGSVGRMVWDNPSFERPINMVAYVRRGPTP